MSDSSDDEEATVCPDDQSIDVGMDDLTLGNGGGGGKTAVPTVSPVDAQPAQRRPYGARLSQMLDHASRQLISILQ